VSALFSADALRAATGGVMTRPFHATGVSIDTRSLAAGDLFVALRTPTGDGHAHLAEALARGAAGCLVHDQAAAPDGAPLLVVADTQAGLTALGTLARERFTGTVVAITGSVGKTTTKEMLRALLARAGETHAAPASYNNHWGVPLTLARVPPDADFAIVEIGMNHPGEIAPLARLAAPDIAVITAIAGAHLGHMGSLEAIAREKASILEGLLAGGGAVLPADAPHADLLREAAGSRRAAWFGAADMLDLRLDAEGSTVEAQVAGERLRFRVGAPGRHMALNALAALNAVALAGLDPAALAPALEDFGAVTGRGARRPVLGGQALLLDESYNASSASIRAALAVLALLPARRRVAVLGDMLELGEHGEAEHRGLAQDLAGSADRLHACGPLMRFLHEAVPDALRGEWAPDAESLAPLVAADARPGDAILVKGSQGSRMRRVVEALEARG
jgi:UDP-N-acetylmuramoyl-tripeptide--D-alanyl-D-alanine ligase